MSSHPARERAFALLALAAVVLAPVAACSSTSDDANVDEAAPNPNGELEGAECKLGSDCRSGRCVDGHCGASPENANSSPTDGIKNGDETDVDCGGSRAGKCDDGKGCAVGNDCKDAICTSGKCAAPGPNDGAKNADETDVDCGGKVAPKCAVDKGCAANSDCASDACSYDKKCVVYKTCVGHFGGDTCGDGETGAAGAKHESCCTTVTVNDRPAAQGGAFTIDKYLVTAGRMRAFIERYDGNLQQWAAGNPAGWNSAWTPNLPANMTDALFMLGPGRKRGCNVVSQGGRTYWQPPIDGQAGESSDFSKDVLDEKALNCVPWYLSAAICTFDGGHLVSNAEMKWVYENRGRAAGPTTYPWQWNDASAYTPTQQDPRVIHRYSYATPNPPGAMRMVNGQYPLDHAFYVAPPGRRPTGANMQGVQDAAGNIMPWVSDTPKNFTWTMSWENHDKNLTPTLWNMTDGPDGYYAIGVRCSR